MLYHLIFILFQPPIISRYEEGWDYGISRRALLLVFSSSSFRVSVFLKIQQRYPFFSRTRIQRPENVFEKARYHKPFTFVSNV